MIELLLDVLAVHRLTRLITADRITRHLRATLIAMSYGDWTGAPYRSPQYSPPLDIEWEHRVELDDDAPLLAALISCRWCVSMWVGLAVVLVLRHVPGWKPIRNALALSSAGTLLADFEG